MKRWPAILFCAWFSCGGDAQAESGLIVTYRSGAAADAVSVSNLWLFVQEGKAPTPFLPAGKFKATWEGNISADLRGDFAFQAEINGSLKLEINGNVAYEASGAGGPAPLGKFVQLNKGSNALHAVYSSPEKGDAFVRLSWTEKGPHTVPVPFGALTHSLTPELKKGLQLHLGRELFLEYRCVNCHKARYEESIPELAMDAPSFDGIGARRNYEWMVRWILDPKVTRANVHMPKLLHGPQAKEDATAMAAYLSSLRTEGEILKASNNVAAAEATEDQKSLFERLHCIGCHDTGDTREAGKMGLKHVAQKFAPGKLAEFLRAPEAHFAWIRMPNFHLTSKEAGELADFLLSKADKPEGHESPSDKEIIDRGRKLIQETGCLNCHGAKLENTFSAPSLSALSADKWDRGCLAAELKAGSKAPEFGFSAEERAALQAFGKTDGQSLTRHVPSEFAARQSRLLNCSRCHGEVEGFPLLDLVGGKLKPEWSAKFIAGDISYKPRPWLEMRMPSFTSRARWLAEGLAAQHGFAPQTPAEPPVNMELAKIGQTLAGKEGGFSCISCHRVGNQPATEVFESEGINLSFSGERLLPQYYRRWVRNPLSIDPQTKMPVYFEEGKSPLTELLNGDAEKQIDALWEYLRLGSKMSPPGTQ